MILLALSPLCCPPLETFKDLNILVKLWGPVLHTVFKVRLHQHWIQQENHLFWPSGYAVFGSSPDAVCPLGCQSTLLTHSECSVNQHLQISFCRVGLQPPVPHFIIVSSIPSFQVQNPAFGFVKFHPINHSQCSNLSRSICKASCPSRESTAPSSLVSSANLLMVQWTPASRSLINVLNWTGPRIEPWGAPLLSRCQTDVAPFTTAAWALPFSQFFIQHTWEPTYPTVGQLVQKDVVRDSIKDLTKIHKNYTHHLPFIH